MAKSHQPNLPKVDQRATSMTKEQRLLAEIAGHKRDALWYKKRWLPSLIGGLIWGVINFVVLSMGYSLRTLAFLGPGLPLLNGFYFLYKWLKETREMEKKQDFARKHKVKMKD